MYDALITPWTVVLSRYWTSFVNVLTGKPVTKAESVKSLVLYCICLAWTYAASTVVAITPEAIEAESRITPALDVT